MSHSRIVIYSIVSLFALIMMLFPYFMANSQRNLQQIASSNATNNTNTTIQTFASYYKKTSYGFILTLYTGHDPAFAAEYVTITKINNDYFVDIITGPGPEGVKLLTGDDADNFIKEHNIDVSNF